MSLLDDLVSHWKLDEASGTRNDSHGTNHLTDNNTTGTDTGLVYPLAANVIAADGEYLSRADNVSLSITGSLTIAFWLYIESAPGAGGILGKWQDNVNERGYLFYSASGDILWLVSSNGSNASSATVTPAQGEWELLVGRHDAIAETISVQLNDGTPVSSARTGGIFDASCDFRIGSRSNGTPDTPADMRIGPVAVWSRVLTTDEVAQIYNGGAGLAYPFASGGVAPALIGAFGFGFGF